MSSNCLILILCVSFCIVSPTDVNLNIKLQNENSDIVVTAVPEGRRKMKDTKPILRIRDTHPIQFLDTINKKVRAANLTSTVNFPYIALIIVNEQPWCAGTIVDVNWIVTAAHCLNYVLHISPMKTLTKYVKARVGSADPNNGGMLVQVAGAIRHPKFEEEPVPHADVALIKLAVDLQFGNTINLLKIYDGTQEPFPQSFVAVTGWGASRGSSVAFKDPIRNLITTRIKVRTQQFCSDAYQLVNGFLFTRDFFCASLRRGARDACLFDAGAPAVQQNRLMGIMSFGPELCGDEFQPAVFVKAFYFKDFVKQTIASYKTTEDLLGVMQDVHKNENTPHKNYEIVKSEQNEDIDNAKIPPTATEKKEDEGLGFF